MQQEPGKPDLGREHGTNVAEFFGPGVLQAQCVVQAALEGGKALQPGEQVLDRHDHDGRRLQCDRARGVVAPAERRIAKHVAPPRKVQYAFTAPGVDPAALECTGAHDVDRIAGVPSWNRVPRAGTKLNCALMALFVTASWPKALNRPSRSWGSCPITDCP